jgi:hypothetical protein
MFPKCSQNVTDKAALENIAPDTLVMGGLGGLPPS